MKIDEPITSLAEFERRMKLALQAQKDVEPPAPTQTLLGRPIVYVDDMPTYDIRCMSWDEWEERRRQRAAERNQRGEQSGAPGNLPDDPAEG